MIKKRKKTKLATKAQKRVRERNWNKGQIRCIIAIAHKIQDSKTTHEKEKINLKIIIAAANIIHQNWNT